VKPVVKAAIIKGWRTPRQIAIAIGISNSMGGGGFSDLAKSQNWSAEKTLKSYANKSEHRKRRMIALNENYPKDKHEDFFSDEIIQTANSNYYSELPEF
jgi:hypothetical protein